MESDFNLKEAVRLSKRLVYFWVITQDENGESHMTVAENISMVATDYLRVETWFCPNTMIDLQQNSAVRLFVWDLDQSRGYEISGELQMTGALQILPKLMQQSTQSRMPEIRYPIHVHLKNVRDVATLAASN